MHLLQGKENDIRDSFIKRNITDDCVTNRHKHARRLDMDFIQLQTGFTRQAHIFIYELNCETVRRPNNRLTNEVAAKVCAVKTLSKLLFNSVDTFGVLNLHSLELPIICIFQAIKHECVLQDYPSIQGRFHGAFSQFRIHVFPLLNPLNYQSAFLTLVAMYFFHIIVT